jgi:hypothetical protein
MFRALLSDPQKTLRNGTWYIACVLSQLAAPRVEFPEHARNIQSAFVQRLLRISKQCSKHVEAPNS